MVLRSISDLRKFQSPELSQIMKNHNLKGISKTKEEKVQIIRNSDIWNESEFPDDSKLDTAVKGFRPHRKAR